MVLLSDHRVTQEVMKPTLEGVMHLIIEDKVRRRLPAVVGKCVRIGGHHVLFRRLHLISSLLNTVYKCKTYGYQRCIIWYIFNVDKLMNQSIYQWLPYLYRYYVSIGLASAEGGVGELTEVRRIAQFFRIMRIVRIFKVSGFSQYSIIIQ